MTALSRALPGFGERTQLHLSAIFPVLIAIVLSIGAGYAVSKDTLIRAVVAGCVVVLLTGLAAVSPKATLYTLIVWLAALGLVRRIVTQTTAPSSADVLLLVGPVALTLLFLVAVQRDAFAFRSPLSVAVGAMTMIAVASAFNPLQGSLSAGIAGLLFIPLPLLAFWIGRSLVVDDSTLARVLLLMSTLAIAGAAYGLFQTFDQFPAWDVTWINEVKTQYTALNIQLAGNIRPFSTFSSAAEFGYYLGIGIVVWLVRGMRAVRLPVTLAVVSFLVVALIYESSRQVIFTLAVSLGLMLGAWRRVPLVTAGVLAVTLLTVIPFAAARISPSGDSSGQSLLVSHQVKGLQNPLDPRHSTGKIHIELVVNGLKSSVQEPLGRGVGAVTIAGGKYSGVEQNTEADPSNAAVAFGIPGFLAYLAILVFGIASAYRLATVRGDWLAIAALGVLGVTLSQWLSGGHYSLAFLPWLVLGWVDRRQNAPPAKRGSEPSG